MEISFMKSFLFVVLVLSISSLFAQDTIADCQNLESNYTGECKTFYENGTLELHNTLINGEIIQQQIFFDDGSPKLIVDLTDKDEFTLTVKSYYKNGQLEGEVIVNKGTGTAKEYFNDGALQMEGRFVDTKLIGPWVRYANDGSTMAILGEEYYGKKSADGDTFVKVIGIAFEELKDEVRRTERNLHEVQSRRNEIITYDDDLYIDGEYVTPDPIAPPAPPIIQEEIIDYAPVDAEFPGGQIALNKFINDSLQYPEVAKKNKEEGRIYVGFIVEGDGSITDVQILKSSGFKLLDEEAIRLVKTMPKWNPAQSGGRVIRSRVTLPFTFSLR